MAVDKVKPLKIESSATGGTEDNLFPTEADPTEDYLAAKGIAFENLDTHLVDRVGNDIRFTDPAVGTETVDGARSKVRVSSNDTTPGNLLTKLVGGAGIALTELNDGGIETLEISSTSAIGALIPYPFVTTGNTNDKWLGAYVPSTLSNVVPLITPQDMDIKGILFSNQDDDVDIDILVYKNSVLAHTEEIRNKRVAWNVGFAGPSFTQGDRISVFLKKFTGGTGDQTAQDPVITLLLKIVDEKAADSGIQFGIV